MDVLEISVLHGKQTRSEKIFNRAEGPKDDRGVGRELKGSMESSKRGDSSGSQGRSGR